MTKDQSKRTKKFLKNKLSAELARRNKFKGGKKSNKQNTNHNSKSNNNAQNSHEDALLKQEIGKLIAGFEKGQKNEKDDSYLQEEESDLEDIDEDVVEFSDNDLDEEDEPKEEEEEDNDENGENDNEEDQEDEEIQNDPQIQQLSSEVQKHKQELESLKKQDPEFAQYLKDHDKELLSFMDESDDEEPEDDDNDLEGHGEMGNEEEEDGKESGEPANVGGSRAVRSVHVDKWINDATQTNSLKSLKRLVVAFRSASHMNDEDYDSTQYHYKIVSSDAFDKLLHFCIGSFGDLFENILNKDGASQTSKKKKKQNKKANAWDTSKWDNNPNWSKLEPLVKSFLGSLIHIMSQITDDKTILFIIQKSEKLAQYFGAFPKLARMFLKAIVDFWGSGAENVKIACFFDLRQLITSIPQFRESVLKSVYLSYVRNSKFYNPKTMKGIMLMCNCLVELYAMDMAVGYKLAFIYIRQLAIHLRNAIQLNTKDALKNVYNWQFVNSLRVWCSLIAGFPEQPEVATLVYPITQLLMAIVTHNPSSKYFPLRFHCIRMLHQIAGPAKVFVNTAPYILETLESPEFKKKAKLTSGKPLGFSSLLKVSKTVLPTNLFQDAVVKNAFELLLHMFSSYANNAAFPELAFPTVVFLKKFIKTNKVPAFTKKMGQLLDQIQRNTQFVQAQRDKAEFKPADIENVKQFLSDNDKAPLQQFYRNWKTTEDRLKQLKQQGEEDDDEDDGEGFSDEEDQPPKKKSKTEDKQTKNKTSNNNKQQENGKTKPNVDKKVLKQVKRKEKKAERKKQKGQNNKDDVVEDFVMSDDE